MTNYLIAYMDELKGLLKEIIDSFLDAICSLMCFVILLMSFPIISLYIPARDLISFCAGK